MNETSNLKMHIDLLRRPLREEARSLVTLALKNAQHRSGVRHLLAEDDEEEIRLDVYPIIARDINERAALVVFSEVEVERFKNTENTRKNGGQGVDADRIRLLEDEVATTREALQHTIEELVTSNEELQSLNEELQSTNEELITVNEELQVTAAELSGRTGELMSVLETAPLAIMVLDTALQISQATNAATELFGLTKPLSSPHVSQCVTPDNFPALAPICNETLRLGEAIHKEFTSGGSRFKLTSSPFFDLRGQMKGVTVVVSEFPGLAHELDLILDQGEIFLLNRAQDGTVLRISEKTAALFGTSRRRAEGANFFKIVPREIAKAAKDWDGKLISSEEEKITYVDVVQRASDRQEIWVNANNFLFHDNAMEEPSIYSIGTDVTEVIKTRDQAEDTLEQLLLLQQIAKIGYWSLNLEDKTVYWSDEVFRIHGEDPRSFEPSYEEALDYYHKDDLENVKAHVNQVMENGGKFHFQHRLINRQGETISVEAFGLARPNAQGEVNRIIGVFRALD